MRVRQGEATPGIAPSAPPLAAQTTHHSATELCRVVLVLGAGAQVVDLEAALVKGVQEPDHLALWVAIDACHARRWQSHRNDLIGDVRQVQVEAADLDPLLLLRDEVLEHFGHCQNPHACRYRQQACRSQQGGQCRVQTALCTSESEITTWTIDRNS